MVWNRVRLVEVASTRLKGARLVDVANGEHYIHVFEGAPHGKKCGDKSQIRTLIAGQAICCLEPRSE